uniref:Uncharacterized protein n=1 Tax=Glossina pallidipes TaxID=7398 RepID=A0A1A9Z857_GLOPL
MKFKIALNAITQASVHSFHCIPVRRAAVTSPPAQSSLQDCLSEMIERRPCRELDELVLNAVVLGKGRFYVDESTEGLLRTFVVSHQSSLIEYNEMCKDGSCLTKIPLVGEFDLQKLPKGIRPYDFYLTKAIASLKTPAPPIIQTVSMLFFNTLLFSKNFIAASRFGCNKTSSGEAMKDFPNKEIVYAMTNHTALGQKKSSNFEDKGSSLSDFNKAILGLFVPVRQGFSSPLVTVGCLTYSSGSLSIAGKPVWLNFII